MTQTPITREELILRMMPFSDGIIRWANQNPNFLNALKIIYPIRFIALGAVYTSTSPYALNDGVVGFIVYDSQKRTFKQDFIVDIGKKNSEYVLYTQLPKNMRAKTFGKFVQPIKQFYEKYAKDKNGNLTDYKNTHHLTIDELGEQLKPRAWRAIALADTLETTGLRNMSQSELDSAAEELQKVQNRKLT